MKFKKLLSAVAATAIAASAFAGMAVTVNAATTYTVSFNGKDEQSTDGYFTFSEKHNFNTKFNGATYDGITFNSGLKMESATAIYFTSTATSTVTIVQSTWSEGVNNFDGTELAVASATAGTGCRVYTISDVEAGEHSITRKSGENGIFYIKVEEEGEGGGEQQQLPKISLSKSTLSLNVDASETLTYNISNVGGATPAVTWESSDTSVATVTDGTVAALAVGTADITASFEYENATYSATCAVTVVNSVLPGKSGSANDLAAAKETKIYDFLAETAKVTAVNGEAVYAPGTLYFGDEIFVVGGGIGDGANGLLYSKKSTYNFDSETANQYGVRIKTTQDLFAVKLSAGSKLEINVTGGGSGSRTAKIYGAYTFDKSAALSDELATTGDLKNYATEILTYTNNGTEDKVVYVSATGDTFFSQVRVTVPQAAEETEDKYFSFTGTGTFNKVVVTSSEHEGKKATIDLDSNITLEGENASFYLKITGVPEGVTLTTELQ